MTWIPRPITLSKSWSEAELYEVEMEDGRILTCSMEHKLLCSDGVMRSLEQILLEKWEIVTD
jgi:hypothetical protein